MRERVQDYLQFGVPYIFILDPRTRTAWRCTTDNIFEVKELATEDPAPLVPVASLFEE